MKTQQGIRLIEINARFGDPEALNVLPLLEHSFVDVCTAITTGTLKQLKLSFARKATVCKYITPPGYGGSPETGVPLSVDTAKISSLGVKVFFAKLDMRNGQLLTTTSRSIALLGIGDSVEEAEERVEEALLKNYVQGRYHVRHDIGKKHLTQRLAQQKVGVRVA
ncbi:MAG: hypothetical protein NTU41_11770 [Chloroflexi bacterium]|nr:hypothetical protein [Chloroflexota bacterium]